MSSPAWQVVASLAKRNFFRTEYAVKVALASPRYRSGFCNVAPRGH
jgi:hypothetical protein